MIFADISINEQWVALPMGVVGLALCLYSLWPTNTVRQVSLVCGIGCLLGAILFLWFGDAPNYKPLPTPSNPDAVVVTPVAGGLADLVPREQRGKIGRFYLSLADVIASATNLKTTEDLREAYVSAGRLMKSACNLPDGLSGFTEATKKMMADSISLESQQLTPALRDKFTSTCRQIAAELGVTQ